MKKVFALVLVVCMMLCTAAFAEYDMILQDELPPAVVTSVNEVGETVAAKIFDAEGNAISEILDDGTVTLVDVYGRKDDHGADSISRLTAAYEGIMAQIHFSDEPCSQHEHEIRVDIDEALAALDKDIDAYDLVMYELFDILDNDSIDALLTDGSYMELTLEVAEYQTAPIVALFTADGEEWEVLPTYAVNGRRFTVRLAETGAIALLQDGYELIGLGKDYEEIVIAPEEGDGDENVNENFTPSVSGKSAPQLNSFEGDDGETYIGRMYDAENDEYISVPDKNYVLITAVAERDYIADIQTHEHLAWAYNGVLEAEDVGELHTVCADDTAAEAEVLSVALDAELADMGLDITHDKLVVKDMFEVTAYGDYLEELYDEANYLEVTVSANADPDMAFIVIHSADSVHWNILPADDYLVGKNGNVSLKLYDLGAVAFLVEAEEAVDAETAVQSPN